MQSVPQDPRPIGIFDSGLGGLTVTRAIQKLLPHEKLIYLGDTARVPYGNRSPQTIRTFAIEDADFLLNQGVKAIVAACNTVSALALDVLKQKLFPIPLTGVIFPGAKSAVDTGGMRIAVLGTRGTISSGAYTKAIHEIRPDVEVIGISCPLLVPIAEEGITDGNIVMDVLGLYLSQLLDNPPDVVLLGCTHYPLFRSALQHFLPDGVKIIDSASSTAHYLAKMLNDYQICAKDNNEGSTQYFVTDLTPGFTSLAHRFLDIPEKEHLSIQFVSNSNQKR